MTVVPEQIRVQMDGGYEAVLGVFVFEYGVMIEVECHVFVAAHHPAVEHFSQIVVGPGLEEDRIERCGFVDDVAKKRRIFVGDAGVVLWEVFEDKWKIHEWVAAGGVGVV